MFAEEMPTNEQGKTVCPRPERAEGAGAAVVTGGLDPPPEALQPTGGCCCHRRSGEHGTRIRSHLLGVGRERSARCRTASNLPGTHTKHELIPTKIGVKS